MPIRCELKQLMREWQAREQADLTYEQLAAATGKGDRTLRRWANNEIRSYDGDVLAELCRFFDVGIDRVLVVANGKD